MTSEYIIDGKEKWKSMMNGLIVSGLLVVSGLLMVSMKVELKREKQDQQHANYDDEGSSP